MFVANLHDRSVQIVMAGCGGGVRVLAIAHVLLVEAENVNSCERHAQVEIIIFCHRQAVVVVGAGGAVGRPIEGGAWIGDEIKAAQEISAVGV